MTLRAHLPWVAVVLGSTSPAWAQATVHEEPTAAPVAGPSVRAAARERRSISLSSDALGPNENAETGEVPEFHTVVRGDTLWDITGAYFQNPWRWPDVWGLNPQITNPHWIFPGDRVRLLPQTVAVGPAAAVRPTQNLNAPTLNLPQARVAPNTVFLREQGWVDEQAEQAAGTIVGSPDDKMLLSEGDQAYVEFQNRTPHVGEEYTVYQEGQPTQDGDRAAGRVVRILGSGTVERWDPNHHVATVRLTESLDGIERGERVAAIPRRLDVVPPTQNQVELRSTIVAAVHPRELLGQQMVVFFDRGSDDHVAVGNRLFIVRRGDALARTTGHGGSLPAGGLDRDGDGNVDSPPGQTAADTNLPEEIVGEVLVVDVRHHSATALVTSSIVEVEVGDQLEMRRGY